MQRLILKTNLTIWFIPMQPPYFFIGGYSEARIYGMKKIQAFKLYDYWTRDLSPLNKG